MDEIKVSVVERAERKYLYLKHIDPLTGQTIWKSAGTTNTDLAQQRAGEWKAEIKNGTAHRKRVVSWADFRERYEAEEVSRMRPTTQTTVVGIFSNFERVMKPDRVSRITKQWIAEYQRQRLKDVSSATVEADCRVLKAALNWAKSEGFIRSVPAFPSLKQSRKARKMKGRPVTLEEFERMLAAVDKVKHLDVKSVKFLLRGLWYSGLRLGEAVDLTWDRWADGIRVDMSGEAAVLLIASEDEKGGQDRVYPVAPEFHDFLAAVPEEDRQGHVFNVELGRGICRNSNTISKKLVAVGKAAGIKVNERRVKDKETGEFVQKSIWASAHDLRRAFGNRWAQRVMPMVLKELMRHKAVLTTEKYYVELNAQETAKLLRSAMLGATSGATSPETTSADFD